LAWSFAVVAAGLVVLVVAADRLVVSAVRVSRAFGLSAVMIGALVVGLGTSLPELLVSALAAREGRLDVAMANVVGSNVANVTLVLGGAAIVAPVVATARVLRREGTIMLAGVTALALVLADDIVGRIEAFGLVAAMVVAAYLILHWSRDGGAIESEVTSMAGPAAGNAIAELVIGFIALIATVAGADLLLDGALDIGTRLGWSATFLGLLLGVGTSLPEFATAIASARRGESDLVLGNVLGSNLFNSLAVAGAAGLIWPARLEGIGAPALALMLGSALVAGAFSRTGGRIVRLEGIVLIAVFLAFAGLVF
jgi:cation:H+ antiporter